MKIIKKNLKWNGRLRTLARVEKLVQHHMAHPSWGFDQVHEYHRDSNKWAGIGYNYWIAFDGTIYEGRGMNQGAHAGPNWNARSLGIGYQGDFQRQFMTDEQLHAGIWLNAKLAKEHGLSEKDIIGHNEAGNTSCPGKNFRLNELREGVKKALNDGPKLILEGKTIDLLLIEGRTYAPVRDVLESAGYKVNWDEETKKVTAKK